MTWWIGLAIIVVVLALYVAWLSSRLDRLHARVDAARAALDAQLVRRSAVTLEIAASGLLDPASSVLLAGAAHEARAASADEREVAESDVTRALLAAFADPAVVAAVAERTDGRGLLDELDGVSTKVALARSFHGDAVRATQAVRHRRLVRTLRLAGSAHEPVYFEMDDTPLDHGADVR